MAWILAFLLTLWAINEVLTAEKSNGVTSILFGSLIFALGMMELQSRGSALPIFLITIGLSMALYGTARLVVYWLQPFILKSFADLQRVKDAVDAEAPVSSHDS